MYKPLIVTSTVLVVHLQDQILLNIKKSPHLQALWTTFPLYPWSNQQCLPAQLFYAWKYTMRAEVLLLVRDIPAHHSPGCASWSFWVIHHAPIWLLCPREYAVTSLLFPQHSQNWVVIPVLTFLDRFFVGACMRYLPEFGSRVHNMPLGIVRSLL